MKQYLVILIDDTSTSYCHYKNETSIQRLISLDDLKAGIVYAMKQNMMIQYILPSYELPAEYKELMNTIDHHLIVPATSVDTNALEAADVLVFNSWQNIEVYPYKNNTVYAIRTNKSDLFANQSSLINILGKVHRINIVLTDIESFSETDYDAYDLLLGRLSKEIERLYVEGKVPQLNLLTDRMMLKTMKNCGAGDTNITLAPDGKFYICPAFYQAQEASKTILNDFYSIGSLEEGVNIQNHQLFKLAHAPLCRKCDAYQCNRCVWLNRKITYEINTPSHEQCVVAHLERNASRKLLANIRKHGTFLQEFEEIKKIDYLDPFDIKDEY